MYIFGSENSLYTPEFDGCIWFIIIFHIEMEHFRYHWLDPILGPAYPSWLPTLPQTQYQNGSEAQMKKPQILVLRVLGF